MKTFVDATGKAMRNKTPRRCGTIFQDQADGAALLKPIPGGGRWRPGPSCGPQQATHVASGDTGCCPPGSHVSPESFQGGSCFSRKASQPCCGDCLRNARTAQPPPAPPARPPEPREGDCQWEPPMVHSQGSFQAMK